MIGIKENEDGIKMPVSSSLQTGGNEKQIRNKIGMQEELGSLTGPRMEFNPTPGSTKREDGLSPDDHVSDYEKVDDPSEQSHVDSTSVISPSRFKKKITKDKIQAAKNAEGDLEAMQENEESRPAFLRELDKTARRRTQQTLTNNYLSPTNYVGGAATCRGTNTSPRPSPSPPCRKKQSPATRRLTTAEAPITP